MAKHTPEPWEAVPEDGEGWTILHRNEDGSVRYLARTMGTYILEFREENEGNATLFAAAPLLLKAACIGWDALSALLESVHATLSEKDKTDAHKAIGKLYDINDELNGLLIEQKDTRN